VSLAELEIDLLFRQCTNYKDLDRTCSSSVY